MADSTVKVNFIGDSSRLKRAVDDAEGHLGRLASGIGDIAKKAAIGFAAVGAGAAVFAKSAISAASDLAESQGKVNVVFKDQAEEITKWAATASKAFGQSKQSALEAVGTFGNLFKAFGIGDKQTAVMSKSLVELAADLASFNNTSVDDALLALRSGLSGEAEPLKKFGVALTDDRLKLEAVKLGLIKTTKEGLTPAAKAQASYSLILKDTALAQGDFARTSDGLANKTRILKARFADIQAEIGTRLLPIVTELAGFFLDKLLPAFQYVSTEIAGGVAAFVGAFRKGDGDITSSGFPGFLEKLGNIARDVFDWLRVNVPPVLEAIGNFITTKVIPALEELAHWVRDELGPALGKMAASFREEIWPVLEEKVLPALGKLAQFIKDEVLPILGKIVIFIIAELIPAFFKIVNWISTELIPKIAEITVMLWHFVIDVKDIAAGIVAVFVGIAEAIYAPFKWAFNEIAKLWNNTVGRLSFSIPGWVPGIGGNGWDVPDIPVLHSGGVFNSGRGQGLALLQDGERVLPIGQSGTTVIFELDGRVLARAMVNESNNSGGLPIRVRAAS